MISLFDISNNTSSDFDLNNDINLPLLDHFFPQLISLNEDIESLNPCFPFHILTEEEKKDLLETNSKKVEKIFNNITRRCKEDDMRKKIKSSFLKTLLIRKNELLKEAGSLYIFESFPQNFIADITQQTNFEVMELTYEQLFDYSHEKVVEENKYLLEKYQERANKVAEKKYVKNIKTLEYLKKNSEISEKSGWERIKKMKYKDLLKAFFNSKEFANSIIKLKQKEDKDYIKNYLYFSLNYIDYFQSYKPSTKKSNKKRKLKSELNQNSGNKSNNPPLMVLPPITTSLFDEVEDDLGDGDLPSLYSSGNYDLTNQVSLLSGEIFEGFY